MLRGVGAYLRVGSPDWAVRRRMAMGLQALAAWMIVYGGVWARTEVAITLISSGTTLSGAVLTIYIAAVVVDDGKKRAAGAAPHADTVGG